MATGKQATHGSGGCIGKNIFWKKVPRLFLPGTFVSFHEVPPTFSFPPGNCVNKKQTLAPRGVDKGYYGVFDSSKKR